MVKILILVDIIDGRLGSLGLFRGVHEKEGDEFILLGTDPRQVINFLSTFLEKLWLAEVNPNLLKSTKRC